MVCILIQPDKGVISQHEECRSSLLTRQRIREVVTLARIWKTQWATSGGPVLLEGCGLNCVPRCVSRQEIDVLEYI